jgi:hypothetical protein
VSRSHYLPHTDCRPAQPSAGCRTRWKSIRSLNGISSCGWDWKRGGTAMDPGFVSQRNGTLALTRSCARHAPQRCRALDRAAGLRSRKTARPMALDVNASANSNGLVKQLGRLMVPETDDALPLILEPLVLECPPSIRRRDLSLRPASYARCTAPRASAGRGGNRKMRLGSMRDHAVVSSRDPGLLLGASLRRALRFRVQAVRLDRARWCATSAPRMGDRWHGRRFQSRGASSDRGHAWCRRSTHVGHYDQAWVRRCPRCRADAGCRSPLCPAALPSKTFSRKCPKPRMIRMINFAGGFNLPIWMAQRRASSQPRKLT